MFNYSYSPLGSLPGTINIQENALPSEIVLIDYSEKECTHLTNLTPEECIPYLDKESVSWIDLAGLGTEDVLLKISEIFKLHPLVLEDVVNVPQRPQIQEYPEQVVIITQMVLIKNDKFWFEQVSFILGKYYLLTIQEEPKYDCFEGVREKIRNNKGVIRQKGADYLTYTLWDQVIDGFFPILETLGERLDELEHEVVINPNKKTLGKIYAIRRELLALRRAIWPQRDAINTLIRSENNLLTKEVVSHLKDCYDHAIQIIDIIETYRELASSLMDVYLSAVSNKMNEIMKLLTIISTIFIPLTFIAGIYGMNFNHDVSPLNMPELEWYWGYPAVWLLMISIASFLSYFFWKSGWFEEIGANLRKKPDSRKKKKKNFYNATARK